jgi:hypothetical protein
MVYVRAGSYERENRSHFGCRDRRTDACLLAESSGIEPTLIEHAATLRTGGYVIDFWGLGYDIAERMGTGLPYVCLTGHLSVSSCRSAMLH